VGVAIALLVACSAAPSACYDVPRPDCGFQCGPADECPDGYSCARDQRCHRLGAPTALVCDTFDAAMPARDAMPDAPIDATVIEPTPDRP